jgi:hypothetical protein
MADAIIEANQGEILTTSEEVAEEVATEMAAE